MVVKVGEWSHLIVSVSLEKTGKRKQVKSLEEKEEEAIQGVKI